MQAGANTQAAERAPGGEALGVRLTQLTPDQAAYIDVPVEGPYKPDHYRY